MRAAVVGGGLAGAAAALELAARGREVVLVRRGPGATALCWGSIDAAGAAPPPGGLPWRDPVHGDVLSPAGRLEFLLRSRPAHPYSTLFPGEGSDAAARAAEAVKSATSTLDAWLRPSGLRVEGSLEEHRLLANVRGAVRVVDFALTGPAGGDLGSTAELALADLPGLAGYDPRPLARSLAAEIAALGLPAFPMRIVRPRLPEGLVPPGGSPARVAARLDDEQARRALARGTAGLGGRGRLILFPPVLGIDQTAEVLAALEDATGARVAELLGAPPWSPAGLRLDLALRAALDRSGVALRTARATGLERRARRATAVVIEGPDGSERIGADTVVLATGRFAGGGLVDGEDGVREPLLDLPLLDPWERRVDGAPAWRNVRLGYAEPQPLFSAGVRTDARLRPLGADGRPLLANLVAAGELLGGFDPAVDRTGLGLALVSGRRAAAETLRLLEAER